MTAYSVGSAVVAARDISGTGVKKGQEGRVIYVQTGGRGLGRSTDLSPSAFQVRFKGGAEVWTTADELASAAAPQDTAEDNAAGTLRARRPGARPPAHGGNPTPVPSERP